jgi:hypothetical protein
MARIETLNWVMFNGTKATLPKQGKRCLVHKQQRSICSIYNVFTKNQVSSVKAEYYFTGFLEGDDWLSACNKISSHCDFWVAPAVLGDSWTYLEEELIWII